jgi:hypothetical protein
MAPPEAVLLTTARADLFSAESIFMMRAGTAPAHRNDGVPDRLDSYRWSPFCRTLQPELGTSGACSA